MKGRKKEGGGLQRVCNWSLVRSTNRAFKVASVELQTWDESLWRCVRATRGRQSGDYHIEFLLLMLLLSLGTCFLSVPLSVSDGETVFTLSDRWCSMKPCVVDLDNAHSYMSNLWRPAHGLWIWLVLKQTYGHVFIHIWLKMILNENKNNKKSFTWHVQHVDCAPTGRYENWKLVWSPAHRSNSRLPPLRYHRILLKTQRRPSGVFWKCAIWTFCVLSLWRVSSVC